MTFLSVWNSTNPLMFRDQSKRSTGFYPKKKVEQHRAGWHTRMVWLISIPSQAVQDIKLLSIIVRAAVNTNGLCT